MASVIDGDRPSKHGAMLGEALALIADLGERDCPVPLGPRCATCAFRAGSVPNQSAGTGTVALNCVLGIDRDGFACHHGMKEGEPQKLCVGYIAAILAPYSTVRQVLEAIFTDLKTVSSGDADETRARFDTWLAATDPAGSMDVYQVARAYQRASPHPLTNAHADGE